MRVPKKKESVSGRQLYDVHGILSNDCVHKNRGNSGASNRWSIHDQLKIPVRSQITTIVFPRVSSMKYFTALTPRKLHAAWNA
ncbi:hypothetical protein GE061_009483 [Apolygus lucorum]|uniref:Uncharacterized protein n=1 Tax=Apolygus lucorum TaxID=248454 RepID=A0A6A4KAT1_APOLU|nr:hypothetical protein GE061_009483 [Apolygus lucorum]